MDDFDEEIHRSISAIKDTKKSITLTPEGLSKIWGIGLKNEMRTLAATNQQIIITTSLLAKRFRTDKYKLRYKKISFHDGTSYVDYLKVGFKSIGEFVGGTLYTNTLGFKKFFPCTNETYEHNGHILQNFINIVGLLTTLHSDDNRNFKEGPFCKLLRKLEYLQHTLRPIHLGRIERNR